MSNQPTQSFFFPDPFDTGEGFSIEAVNLEDAYKQLEQRRPQDPQQDTPHPTVKDSAPAPEADQSSIERNKS